MFAKLFGKKAAPQPAPLPFLVAQLNARIQPMHRGEFFEDPLHDELERAGLGEVSGGGTMQEESGEISFCDIEIALAGSAASADAAAMVIAVLERLGAPKGSKLKIEGEDREVPFGVTEGMAVYLNGTDLAPEVYRDCDSNIVHSELERLLGPEGRVLSYWQGPTETAFYLYGSSYQEMEARIADFLASYPLCQRCRLQQIA